MSAIVFFLISVSSFGLFSVYALINIIPFLDIEKLPRHSGTYILGIISLIIGLVLSVIFRNYVLSLTKLSNQTIVTDKIRYNITEQIRYVIILLEHKWSVKNITVNFESYEYFITANAELLQQLWINILDNAIKFSPHGSEIYLNISKNNDLLIFTVADEGKGMSETEAKHAFDRFFQGDISHKSSGHGIGLAISKKICELHKGNIRIKQTDETGTVFEITLPSGI